MSPLHALRAGLTDSSLRLAILVGLASVPFTVALSWGPVADDVMVIGGSISGAPILVAGLLVGYHYNDRPTETRRAGIWAGMAGSIGTMIVFLANAITSLPAVSSRIGLVGVIATPIVVAIGVGFTVVMTCTAALFGQWVTTRLLRGQAQSGERKPETAQKWRYALLIYAIIAPVTLIHALVIDPQHGISLGFSIVSMFVLAPLSIIALAGLFIQVTAPPKGPNTLATVSLYVGVPIGVYALLYSVTGLRGFEDQAPIGLIGFMIALWLTTTLYLSSSDRRPITA